MGTIFWQWFPVAKWYYTYRPILGIDFYNTVTYVSYLSRHFAFPFNGWKYIWWSGVPFSSDYPLLHMYLILPLTKFFTSPQAVQMYVLFTITVYLAFAYLLFFKVSRNQILSAVLSISVGLSPGLYGALIMGGSLPYFATQMFLPLLLWLLFNYFESGSKRWFYLAAMSLGISFLGHPQIGIISYTPVILILFLLHPVSEANLNYKKRLINIVLFFVVAVIVGYGQMWQYVGTTPLDSLSRIPRVLRSFFGVKSISVSLGGGVSESSIPYETLMAIKKYDADQIVRIWKDSFLLLNYLLAGALSLIPFIFLLKKRKSEILGVLGGLLIVLYYIAYAWLATKGINVFHGGWYRTFWPISFSVGLFVAYTWGDFIATVKERFTALNSTISSITLFIFSGIIFGSIGAMFFSMIPVSKIISSIEIPKYRQNSSAFPDALNVYIEPKEFTKISKMVVPDWLNPNDQNYRFYEVDQKVSIWWNTFFNMPQFRGYIDSPIGDVAGNYYWATTAITQSSDRRNILVENWKVPADIAYNNALFLIDWFSIKYIESEHERSDSFNPLTTYIEGSEIFNKKDKVVIPGWVKFAETPDEQPIRWEPEVEEYLTYYEIKDTFTSPIAHPTDAATIGMIGNSESYNSLIRTLATLDLNSRSIIPIKLGEKIDDVSLDNLKDMDMILLYGYDYQNHESAWRKIENFVKDGGRVLIETGSDVKQTSTIDLPAAFPKELPAVFPISSTQKKQIGTVWDLQTAGTIETNNIDLTKFAPPLIDNNAWYFSLPVETEMRTGAQAIISNGNIPLIVSWNFGSGKVIWSGVNFPYHINIHKNLEEATLFKNLLESLVDISVVDYTNYQSQRVAAGKVEINGKGAKGVLLRDEFYPGWNAKISASKYNGNTRIYRAGPALMGFMYVKIPPILQTEDFTVTYSYRGDPQMYFWSLVSFMAVLLILDYSFLGSRTVVPLLGKIYIPFANRVKKWWSKDDDEYK